MGAAGSGGVAVSSQAAAATCRACLLRMKPPPSDKLYLYLPQLLHVCSSCDRYSGRVVGLVLLRQLLMCMEVGVAVWTDWS